jgi:DNA-directed RNA polymerase subunit RPC12/RpoP
MSSPAEMISVSCNHCGAPLRVDSATRFATCTYCGAQLQVHVEGGVAYTEVLEKIDARTQQIAEDVREIKQYKSVEELDREWSQTRESHKRRSRDGVERMPSVIGSVVAGVVGVIFGAIWITMVNVLRGPFTTQVHFHDAAGNEVPPPAGFTIPGQTSPAVGPFGSVFSDTQAIFSFVGVLIIIASIGGAIYGMVKANAYANDEEAYLHRRQQLTDSNRQ